MPKKQYFCIMISSFGTQLEQWYESFGRDLPWRRTSDPYLIMLSEFILQQTQIVQGMNYYLRFAERFPTAESLAEASEEEVLRLWQGLGYYSRARNLHKAAQKIAEAGCFPKDYSFVRALPGVGDYTAAAIMSLAFGEPHAVLDGNVQRVLARHFGIAEPIDTMQGKKLLRALADELLDRQHPALYNQAIMDFGALQCKPAAPLCETCPLAETCEALSTHQVDKLPDPDGIAAQIKAQLGIAPVLASATTGMGIDDVRQAIILASPQATVERSITGDMVKPGDSVLLVMPQDRQAPKGRLILPQVQTIRDLLDNGCIITCCTPDQMEHALATLCQPPALVITDSQVFAEVYRLCPEESRLTSFSILMAAWKGDLAVMLDGAKALDSLTPQSRVLIAEACTHAPLSEDIGREKIPALLRKRVGQSLQVDVVAGRDFPADLTDYDVVIHCGACMFNRRYMLSRIRQAQQQGVPITNYGLTIARLKGILRSLHGA